MRTVSISPLYVTVSISFVFLCLLPALEFSFDPDVYNFSESTMDGNVPLSVSLAGDLGEFIIQVATATDDSSTEATAIGNYIHDV
jgi:hypothetical protein